MRPRLASIGAAAAILLGVGALAVLISPSLLEPVDGGGAPREALTLAGLVALVVAALVAAGPGLILLVYARAARRAQVVSEASQQALLDELRATSHRPKETPLVSRSEADPRLRRLLTPRRPRGGSGRSRGGRRLRTDMAGKATR